MQAKTIAAALTLGLAATAMPAHAADGSLPAQAASAVGNYIAQQGNAALLQIREELREQLTEALMPVLAPPADVAEPAQTTANAD